jgi:serine/threonine protein kinase
LTDSSAGEVERHLERCDDCRRRIAEISSDSFFRRMREAQRPASPSSAGADPVPTGAAPERDSLPAGLAEHPDYQVIRELGRGGMGVVYLARNRLMGRDEVLKILSRDIIDRPGILDRFLREIRAVARLRHPNVVAAYSAFRLGDNLVFAMEYVDGLDLARMVKVKGPMPVGHAAFFAQQAALGLQHASEEGLVHRDIKPSNLMLSRKGDRAIVKVLDFGLARVTRENESDGALTHSGQMLGTPHFIAPEQTLDPQKADIRADIYSLGCTLYYLLTGGPPFDGTSLYDILQAHHSMDAMPLNLKRPEVPVELAALVAKMMAKEPERRFQTPAEAAQALTPFYKGGGQRSPVVVAPAADPPVARKAPGQAEPASPQPAAEASPPARTEVEATKPPALEPNWSSLIEIREPESIRDPAPAPPPQDDVARRPPWFWPSVAAGVLLLGFVVAYIAIVKVRTKNGMIVLENLPEQAVVLVDGDKAKVEWPDGGGPVEITIPAGKHGVTVRKEGFEAFGTEVTIEAGKRQNIRIILEPLAASAAGGSPAGAQDAADATLVG